MPDDKGKLTLAEKQVILEWWRRHRNGQTMACPVCNNPDWIIADHVVQPITSASNLIIGGEGYPQIMLVSKQCGYTIYFNAVMIGIIEKVAQKQPKEGEASQGDSPKVEASNG